MFIAMLVVIKIITSESLSRQSCLIGVKITVEIVNRSHKFMLSDADKNSFLPELKPTL
jgi:hypothetical protein